LRIDLKVPFDKKDEAKKLGARWDGIKKVWYVENKEDLTPFVNWIDERLMKPSKP